MSNSLKRTYEAMFLVDSAVATADWNEVKETINKVMARAEVEVISLQKWDERRLAYEIAKHKRGTYILCYFKADPEAIGGIERDVQLSELLLRVLILQPDNITEEKMQALTPAMQREAAEHEAAEKAKQADESKDKREDKTAEPEAVTETAIETATETGTEVEAGTEAEADTEVEAEIEPAEPKLEAESVQLQSECVEDTVTDESAPEQEDTKQS